MFATSGCTCDDPTCTYPDWPATVSPFVQRNLDHAQYPQPRGSQYEGPGTLGLVDHADQRLEDLLVAHDQLVSIDDLVALEHIRARHPAMFTEDFIACTVELDERGRFVFGDEFDISA